MDRLTEQLLDELDVIDEYIKQDYTPLRRTLRVTRLTEKAVLIWPYWIPKSLMRCDPEGGLWVESWFAERNME